MLVEPAECAEVVLGKKALTSRAEIDSGNVVCAAPILLLGECCGETCHPNFHIVEPTGDVIG